MPGKHGIANLLIAVMALSLLLVSAGYAGDQAPDLVTDRPDQTESSETVPPGYVQFEFGWTHAEDDDGADVTTDSFPEMLVRLGVAEDLEFRFGFAGYTWEDVDAPGEASQSEHGAGDLEVGLKWRFWSESGYRPQTALLAGTTLPTGATGFSSERFDPSVRLACSHTLTETLGLGYNLGTSWVTEEDAFGDRHTEAFAVYTVALGIALPFGHAHADVINYAFILLFRLS